MEKTTANNDISFYNEITLKEFFQLVLSSKKILLLITLLTTVVLTSYVYFLKPTMFEANAKIVIGMADESSLINLEKIETIMRFHFKYDFKFIPYQNDYLELKIQANSEEKVISKINELAQYIFDKSNENLNKKNTSLTNLVHKVQNNISNIDKQIKSIDGLLDGSDNDIESLPLVIQKLNLESKMEELRQIEDNTLTKLNLAEKSSFFEPIKVVALDKKEFFYAIFGFILGLALSIIFVILRKSYSIEKNSFKES